MSEFQINEVSEIRRLRRHGRSMANLCQRFAANHTRAEMLEVIDAQRRYPDDWDALEHVNYVLAGQSAGVPFVNGTPAYERAVGAGAWVQKGRGPAPHRPWSRDLRHGLRLHPTPDF